MNHQEKKSKKSRPLLGHRGRTSRDNGDDKLLLDVDSELRKASRYHQVGQLQKAEQIYKRILHNNPDDVRCLHRLGVIAHQIGRTDIAVDLINKAIQRDPTNAIYYNDLGNAFQNQRKLDEAVSCYHKALELKPDIAGVYNNLGNALRGQGRSNEAISCYRKAVQLRPDYAAGYHNLGNALQEQGRLSEAISCYHKTLELKPDYLVAYCDLGTALQLEGKLNQAISCYRKALQIKPDPIIQVKSSLLLPVICESKMAIEQARKNITRKLDLLRNKGLRLDAPHIQVGSPHFFLAYHGMNDKQIQQELASFYIYACPNLDSTLVNCDDEPQRDDKIIIGIISRHLFDHTIGNLNYGIIKHLSREKFHVKVLRFPGREDSLSKAIDNASDEVIILPTELMAARHKIASQSLDILFYLDIGMEPLTYFLAFSRLAPVQCVTWGHPVTTGIPNMDYYISSKNAEPVGAEGHYSERLVLLKRFAMYCYRPELPEGMPSREKFGLSKGHNVYACPQTLFKFHPDFDEILGAILRRDPCGLLVLFKAKHKHWERLLCERFARVFPDAMNRVHFLPRMPKKDFLSFLKVVDVLLDTRHFTGGYSSLLALACGVPIVTWPGFFMRGRLTLALYKQIDVMDCVASDVQSYVDIAVRIANDKSWAKEIRAKIKARTDVLFEDMEAVRELERFFERAVRQAEKKPS